MDNEFLQSFLKTGLFEIGDSDDRLEKLRKSIKDLQKRFEEDYSLLPKYTLVSIDPNISDTEPALLETEKIVTLHWETLRSKYPEMPRNILRGVILNAINNVGTSNAIAARIIYLTALNLYPYVILNKEKEIIENLIKKLGEIAEKNAIDKWSFIEEEPKLKIGTLKINGINFGVVQQINKPNLKANLINASNRSSGYNPYQHPDQWAEHFAQNATEGISTAFETALKDLKPLDATLIENPINKFFSEFKKSLDDNLKTSFASLVAVERRSKLLWWKETLYSSSLQKSYRELDKTLLPIVMGVDLNNQIPKVTPISVDYLLRDTIFLLNGRTDEQVKITEFLEAISQDKAKEVLKPFFPVLNEEEGRISITDFIGLLINDRLRITDFQKRTGIIENKESTISDMAVAILHDFLTQRLITD